MALAFPGRDGFLWRNGFLRRRFLLCRFYLGGFGCFLYHSATKLSISYRTHIYILYLDQTIAGQRPENCRIEALPIKDFFSQIFARVKIVHLLCISKYFLYTNQHTPKPYNKTL